MILSTYIRSGHLCTLFPEQVWESDYHFTFDHILLSFHIYSTKPYPCTNFSHSHNVHARLWRSLIKFLNIKCCYSISHVLREKCYYSLSHKSHLTFFLNKFGSWLSLYLWSQLMILSTHLERSSMHTFSWTSLGVWVSLYFWSHLIILSTYIWPNPIHGRISLIVTMCTLGCDAH